MSNLEIFLLVILILFSLYLGWKIREIYKNLKFYLYKKKGKKAEQKAIKLLKKNGYKIESFQTTAKGKLLQDDETLTFLIRADLIVSKNNKKFIAEVKSGKAASIEEINTRRQLLEYSKVFNNKNLILIDTEKNKIKKIEF
tara:strand:- start:120 stop:542 length:423 start_codon:yes stop_codon:yes gene_type:complete